MNIEERYLDGNYLAANPSWHQEDATWKAEQVVKILKDWQIQPTSLVEVGCGSGEVLRCLRGSFPDTSLVGYDISPQAAQLWEGGLKTDCVTFRRADFHELNELLFDVVLMLDVFEHLRDPFSFIEKTRLHGKKFVFHIPLDLSALGIARGTPLLNTRRSVGHLHFYTKDLALETLTDCGYKIIEWRYTGASQTAPVYSFKTRLARLPRLLAYSLAKDLGVRLLGGETLLVLAE